MTTFANDFIMLEIPGEPVRRLKCDQIGLTWPPPERLCVDEFGLRIANGDDPDELVLVRRSMSIITDEERAAMSAVSRGAVYAPLVVPAAAS